MKNDLIKTEIDVKNNKVGIMRIGNVDYISLTDLARYVDNDEPRLPIRDWMRNKETIAYLFNNKILKGGEFDTFKNEAVVIDLKCFHKNGLGRQMLLELFLNREDMKVEHLLNHLIMNYEMIQIIHY